MKRRTQKKQVNRRARACDKASKRLNGLHERIRLMESIREVQRQHASVKQQLGLAN